MKILFVTGSFPPMHCGVGDYAGRLSTTLAEDLEIGVSVLTSKVEPIAPTQTSVRVFRSVANWDPSVVDEFRRVAGQVQPDIVHIQFPTQGYNTADGLVAMIRDARRNLRVPVIATLHEFIPRGFTKAGHAILLIALLADRVVVVRPDFRQNMSLFAKAAIRGSKIKVIANASVVPKVDLSAVQREQIRSEMDCDSRKLVTFFGFAYPAKRIELLFEITDPELHHLLLISDLKSGDPYHDKLRALAQSDRWKGKVTLAGFAPPDEVGRLLAASDAAVFPFREGGGLWNSSLHAATTQGTFTLTTSSARKGYSAETNTYYAQPNELNTMRAALLEYAGVRRQRDDREIDPWQEIVAKHKQLYLSVIRGDRRS